MPAEALYDLAHHSPEDILAPEELPIGSDEDCSIASAPIPGYGTE